MGAAEHYRRGGRRFKRRHIRRTLGRRCDGSQEIEKFAHVIFSSSPKDRAFWLGQRGLSVEQLRENYAGRKAYLHGSDAHEHSSVGQPANDRYS